MELLIFKLVVDKGMQSSGVARRQTPSVPDPSIAPLFFFRKLENFGN